MSTSATVETSRGQRLAPARHASLPSPLTAFIGREKALASVRDVVRTQRLVTLLGPGGCGKTRLAIEAGRECAPHFADGVVWVELASLTDASLVAQTVADAFGIRHQAGTTAQESLAGHTAGRSVLIILDNCEHVIGEAAELVATLLQSAPGVHVLATSRERLGVPGEQSWTVSPLGVPSRRARDTDAVLGTESVRLFMDRAAAVMPAYALDESAVGAVAEICVRLDGIPLAIELAAARMNVLAPQQIAARLADAMGLLTAGSRTLPARQRTLRAAIDWSHALLSNAERVLFRRLAVFGGTFALDAAEAVCGDEVLPACDVLETLAGLADKSLVAVRERDGEARYRLLETVRQYATEQLDVAGEARLLRERHAQHVAAVVRRHAPRMRSAMRPRAVNFIDMELDNVRAALEWTRETPGFLALHHELAALLWSYWLYRVLWDEGLQRLSAAIAAADATVPPLALADTLYGAGMLAWVNGQFLQARVWLERCVELRREAGDAGGLGRALCSLAQPVADLGDRELALALAEEGMPLARAHSLAWDIAAAATSYGYVHHSSGRLDAAEQAYLEADALWSEPADDWSRSLSRNSLAVLAWRRGDLAAAEAHARESLAALRDLGDRWFAARTLLILGFIALQRGEHARSTRLLASSESLRREVGARLMTFELPHWHQTLEHNRAALGSTFDDVWREGAAFVFAEALDFALAGDAHEPTQGSPTHAAAANVVSAGRGSDVGGGRGPRVVIGDGPDAVAAGPRLDIVDAGTGPYGALPSEPEAALVVSALGALQIRRDGRVIPNEEWTYARPRELLVYLLCHPGGRTKEQIGLDLWPDATPARLRSSFHVTMHHVRRVLGATEWLAYDEGRYRFVAIRPTHFDVTGFQQALAQADAAATDEARLPLLESAVAMYRGDFLDDAGFGDWCESLRDELRRRFTHACITAGCLRLQAGQHMQAEAAARRVLAGDNLDERAHRLLLECFAATGRAADAARHFHLLSALFREELGVPPSAETADLAARITSATARV